MASPIGSGPKSAVTYTSASGGTSSPVPSELKPIGEELKALKAQKETLKAQEPLLKQSEIINLAKNFIQIKWPTEGWVATGGLFSRISSIDFTKDTISTLFDKLRGNLGAYGCLSIHGNRNCSVGAALKELGIKSGDTLYFCPSVRAWYRTPPRGNYIQLY